MSDIIIRPAIPADVDAIAAYLPQVKAGMHERGNPQWGKQYPERADYAGDLERRELYVAELDGGVAGAFCANTNGAAEYVQLTWTTSAPALVIHRLAVNPAFWHRGVGRACFAGAEDVARGLGLGALRVDTYSANREMQALIKARGFSFVGEIHFDRDGLAGPYFCFEKAL